LNVGGRILIAQGFDLTELSRAYREGTERLRRVLLGGCCASGTVLAVVGLAILTSQSSDIGSARAVVGWVLFPLGLAIASITYGLIRTAPAIATWISVTDTRVRVEAKSGRFLEVPWSSPDLKITIYDRRGVGTRARGLTPIDWVLDFGWEAHFVAAIPAETMDALRRAALSNGFVVSGWDSNPRPTQRTRVIHIRAKAT
jgi:hypothetical protein